MEDPNFKAKLAADPKGTVANSLGLTLPPQVNVHVLQETPTTAYLVLYHEPHRQAWQIPPAVMAKVPVKH